MTEKTALEPFLRRIVPALPELLLAYACYQGAMTALDGQPISLYLYGLIIIELLSLSWLRLNLASAGVSQQKGRLRKLLGIGGTGTAFVVLVLNLILAGIALIFVMFADPRSFVLLLLALSRRSIWRWSWSLGSIEDVELLQQHSKRTFRAHYLALAAALAVTLLMANLIDSEAMTTQLSDALWLAGMSGYFVSVAIYLLAGKTPATLPDKEESALAEIPLPEFGSLAKLLVRHWMSFLPGMILLALMMEWFYTVVDPDLRVIASPIIVGMGSGLLLAGAVRALDITSQSIWGFVILSGELLSRLLTLWMMSLFMMLVSVPVVFGILGQEISATEYPAESQLGFLICLTGIVYVLVRLWPLMIMPYLLPTELLPPVIPTSFKIAWRMTSGLDGFIRGATPPLLMMVPISLALWLPEDILWIGKLAIYLVLAPFMALLLVDRAITMAGERWPSEEDVALDTDTESNPHASPAEPCLSTPPDVIVPIPVPSPGPSTKTSAPATDRVEVQRTEYPSSWSSEDIFFSGISDQDVKVMQAMLDQGVNINAEADRTPALLWAAHLKKPISFRFLLDAGADIGGLSITGWNVLHYAASRQSMVHFIPELAEKLGGVDISDNRGQTPLMAALRSGCVNGARTLLRLGADPHCQDDRGSNIIYHYMDARRGFQEDETKQENLALLQDLLDMNINPLECGEYGNHAVALAAAQGAVEILDMFHATGANLGQPNEADQTALTAAAFAGHFELVNHLQSLGYILDLPTATIMGQLDRLQTTLEQDQINLDARLPPYKQTLLSLAVNFGRKNIAEWLLDKGADVAGDSSSGNDLLRDAIYHLPDTNFIQRLIDHGANLESVDGDLNTPLNFAARTDDLAVARVLLDAGANPDARTERGYPPKFFAKSDAMVELLESYLKE